MKIKTILIIALVVSTFCGTIRTHADKSVANKNPYVAGITANTSGEAAVLHQEDLLNEAGKNALRTGHFDEAEKDYRTIQALDGSDAEAYQGIGEALAGQGRLAEAIQAYQTLIYQDPFKWSSIVLDVRTQMHYAILLSLVGRWPEAVSIYEKALPDTPKFGVAPITEVHFDPHVPMPTQLQAMARIASGLEYFGGGEIMDAFREFSKALSLAPESAFTNYYYGYGWQSLDPQDKAMIASAKKAKNAFQKAAKIGNATVKKAAQQALKTAGQLP